MFISTHYQPTRTPNDQTKFEHVYAFVLGEHCSIRFCGKDRQFAWSNLLHLRVGLCHDPVSEEGYDNAAELLVVSHVDLQLYLDAAKVALQRYVHFGSLDQKIERFAFEAEDIYHYCQAKMVIRTGASTTNFWPSDSVDS